MFKTFVKQKLVSITSLLFVFVLMVDPGNSVLRLKIPSFLLLIISLFLSDRPNIKYVGIILSLVAMHMISVMMGILGGVEMDGQICSQYLLFYILLIILCWDKDIDFMLPLTLSCLAVSIISIVGFVAMQSYPFLEEALYQYSESHNHPFFMAHRTFLGVEFVSFFYRTLPVVMIPVAIHYERFLFEKKHRMTNLSMVIIYLIALFSGGNRTMFLGIFAIIAIMTYPKVKHLRIVRLGVIVTMFVGFYIAYLAITDSDSESSSVKFGHLLSYADLLNGHLEYLAFGMGPGAYFYSKGEGEVISITEWTYFEIIRMYGLIGLLIFLYLLLFPIIKHNNRLHPVRYWRSISWSYLFFLISCMSNPYLIGSTGLVCIAFMYSVVSNPKYKIEKV